MDFWKDRAHRKVYIRGMLAWSPPSLKVQKKRHFSFLRSESIDYLYFESSLANVQLFVIPHNELYVHFAMRAVSVSRHFPGEEAKIKEEENEKFRGERRGNCKENAPYSVPLSHSHQRTVKDFFLLRWIHPGPPSTVFLDAHCISSPIGTYHSSR